MARTSVDVKATASQIRERAVEVRSVVSSRGLADPRLRDDGAVVIIPSDDGYRDVIDVAQALAELVGGYVHVITDDSPGASGANPL